MSCYRCPCSDKKTCFNRQVTQTGPKQTGNSWALSIDQDSPIPTQKKMTPKTHNGGFAEHLARDVCCLPMFYSLSSDNRSVQSTCTAPFDSNHGQPMRVLTRSGSSSGSAPMSTRGEKKEHSLLVRTWIYVEPKSATSYSDV